MTAAGEIKGSAAQCRPTTTRCEVTRAAADASSSIKHVHGPALASASPQDRACRTAKVNAHRSRAPLNAASRRRANAPSTNDPHTARHCAVQRLFPPSQLDGRHATYHRTTATQVKFAGRLSLHELQGCSGAGTRGTASPPLLKIASGCNKQQSAKHKPTQPVSKLSKLVTGGIFHGEKLLYAGEGDASLSHPTAEPPLDVLHEHRPVC